VEERSNFGVSFEAMEIGIYQITVESAGIVAYFFQGHSCAVFYTVGFVMAHRGEYFGNPHNLFFKTYMGSPEPKGLTEDLSEKTSHIMIFVDLLHYRHLQRTNIACERTSGMKTTTIWRIDQRRNISTRN